MRARAKTRVGKSFAWFLVAAACLAAACAPPKPVVSPGLSAAEVQARLADADALAARGCYLCLREASAAYFKLMALSNSPVVARHAVENELIMATREVELRLPDSGARERARGITVRLAPTAPGPGKPDTTNASTTEYDLYFPLADKPAPLTNMTIESYRQRDVDRKALADKLDLAWPSSAMAAYFYIPLATASGRDALKEKAAAILAAHPGNLAVKYRIQIDPAMYSDADAVAMLEQEPRFAELHYTRGQRAVAGTDLVTGHKEYVLAYDTLPDSLTITAAFGGLELAFGRFAEALVLFDRVLAREPDQDAQMGRAIALSSLRRHADAIAYLDELLRDLSWRPGDKYYWRAWNQLQLGHLQEAYDDANTGLKSMVNTNIYQVAGIAAYKLTKVPEARADFGMSVQMNAGNCDSIRYLGVIDAAERHWPVAVARFTAAARCYKDAMAEIEAELTVKQADASGLYAGQVAGLMAELAEAKDLLEISLHNAEVATKNAKQ